jgi:hypothetical protein
MAPALNLKRVPGRGERRTSSEYNISRKKENMWQSSLALDPV